jgi:hypothetical protein
VNEEEVVEQFLKYLSSRGLSICNFSQTSNLFWPIDTEKIAERFASR